MNMLSPHFALAEFVVSQTAARRGIDNLPPPAIVETLKRTAQQMESVRTLLAAPIIITSGYRCPRLNAAVGSRPSSQHVLGEAVDFIAPMFGSPSIVAARLKDSDTPYDQLILEFGRWVHISFAERPRHEALIIDHTGTRPMWSN